MQSSKKRQRKKKSLQRYRALSDNSIEKKMFISKNDRQDRSLTGQVHDQAGHCPLTGRYLQPWVRLVICSEPIPISWPLFHCLLRNSVAYHQGPVFFLSVAGYLVLYLLKFFPLKCPRHKLSSYNVAETPRQF